MADSSTLLQIAIREAVKSPMSYRHGAVLVSKNKILGSGFNNFSHSVGNVNFQIPGRKKPCVHAEVSALKGIRHDQIRGSTIFVIRINREHDLKMSYPCKRCVSMLRRKGVRKVTFSTGSGYFDHIYL